MLDLLNRIVNAQDVDISETPPTYQTAVNVGRNGLAGEVWFVVHVTVGSAEAVEPVTFTLQYTIDNGSTWNDCAAVTFQTLVATSTEILAVPVGPIDLRVEAYATANIDVRVKEVYTEVEVADDITYSAYLAGPQGYPPSDDV